MHGPREYPTMIFWTCFTGMDICIAGQTMGRASPFLLLSHDAHRENGDDYDNGRNEYHTTNCY